MKKTLAIENSKTEIINKLKGLKGTTSEENIKKEIDHIIKDIEENV